ncbi:MAG: sugar ABC transporter permease [Treponema sp.]|nr:sugar ABC transporter permease [Treponema sp.]
MKKKQRANPWIVVYLAPITILFLVFFLFPLVFNAYTSLMRWTGSGTMKWNNFANYVRLLTDDTFFLSIRNNLIWALSQGFVQISFAALVALILARNPRGWKFLRTVYFLPNVISTVAIASVWVALYNPEYGPINAIIKLFGGTPRNWLGDTSTALFAIIAMTVIYIGYFMIIILASIMNIPKELYEAAQIDGASKVQQELLITIPMIRGTLVTAVTLAMAYGMRHFDTTYLMTGGGPAYATNTIGIALYQKMDALRYGDASAAGMILIALGAVVVSLIRAAMGKNDPMTESAQ